MMFLSIKNSRIYVSNSTNIMLLSLKKKSFDTLYQWESSLINKLMTISENFIVFSTKYNDIYILERKSKDSFAECKIISGDYVPELLKMVIPQYDLNIFDYSTWEDMLSKRRESKQLKIPYKIISYVILSDLYIIFSAYNTENEIYLVMYNTKLNWIDSSIELPKFFKPISIELTESKEKLLVLAMRKGEQDLNPTDKTSLETLPYQEHYSYTIWINKYRVRTDGKLNKSMSMDLIQAAKLPQKLIHIKLIKDNYYIWSSGRKLFFYEFIEEDNVLLPVEGVTEIKLDGSERDVLMKSLTTKLLKDEIQAFEAYGALKKEVIRDIQWFEDALTGNQKVYFLFVTTNIKVYLYRIEFPHNEFYLLQIKELEEQKEQLAEVTWTFLCSLKVSQEWAESVKVIKLQNGNLVLLIFIELKLVVYANKDEIWYISINRKLDAYYKNIEYSLTKNIVWKRDPNDRSKLIDLHWYKCNNTEWKVVMEGTKDFLRVKLV